MGLPVIMELPKGEATEIVESHNLGLVIEPESPAALVEAVNQLHENKDLRLAFSRSAVPAAENFGRSGRAREMLEELCALARESLDGVE